jgi:hypothetical protein
LDAQAIWGWNGPGPFKTMSNNQTQQSRWFLIRNDFFANMRALMFVQGKRNLSAIALMLHHALAMGVVTTVGAADWHAAPEGSSKGQGTLSSPWDLASALAGRHAVSPGDTLWLAPGTYKHPPVAVGMGFAVHLAGREQAPIHVRGCRGTRVTIDGGLDLQAPCTHLWIWDLEITVSEPRPETPVPPDSTYRNVGRPWGGLNVYSGTNCRFINLVIHDNCQGASWWSTSRDSEMHGCVFYDNGWLGTDRGHGHAVYTQNRDGVKRITDCIFTGGFGYTLHAYGSDRADVDNYHVEGNIAYAAHTFLIGGGKPSHGIRLLTNFFYGVPVQLGYSAPTNRDCEVRGNVIINGGLSINHFQQVVNEDNLVWATESPRPPGARVVVRPNQYDPYRANVAVFNWDKNAMIAIDASLFLRPGDRFRLLNPRELYGHAVVEGESTGAPIVVPVAGEFAAFVLLKTTAAKADPARKHRFDEYPDLQQTGK